MVESAMQWNTSKSVDEFFKTHALKDQKNFREKSERCTKRRHKIERHKMEKMVWSYWIIADGSKKQLQTSIMFPLS